MDKTCVIVVAVGIGVLVVLAGIALYGGPVPAFPQALESWTGWVASIVAIIVSARVLWTTAEALVARLKRQ
jgi:hypothetical protein